jgi:hypothetical protein
MGIRALAIHISPPQRSFMGAGTLWTTRPMDTGTLEIAVRKTLKND